MKPASAPLIVALLALQRHGQGVNGATVTLSVPLIWLAEQGNLNNVVCTGIDGIFVLGFPIVQYYYLAYDVADNTVTFVDLQLSDETKAFLYGNELGGINPPSSGYNYHDVPTMSSLMVVIGILLLSFQSIF